MTAVGPAQAGTFAALAISLTACAGPHVELSTPPASVSFEERRDAYSRLRPKGMRIERYAGYVDSSIELSDGTLVHHYSDLVPVLPQDSRSARSARRADRYGSRGNLGYTIGSAASLGGIYLLGEWLSSESGGPHGAIGGGLILGGLVTLGVGWYFQSEADDARKTLRRNLDDDLRSRLRLCRDKHARIIDCEVGGAAR